MAKDWERRFYPERGRYPRGTRTLVALILPLFYGLCIAIGGSDSATGASRLTVMSYVVEGFAIVFVAVIAYFDLRPRIKR